MSDVQFGDEQDPSVLYSRIAKSNTPPGIVSWLADRLGINQHIIALTLITLSLAVIVFAFTLPSLIIDDPLPVITDEDLKTLAEFN